LVRHGSSRGSRIASDPEAFSRHISAQMNVD
jgi:hypothetical protein